MAIAPTNPETKPLLDVDALAAQFCLSQRTVWRLTSAGKLPAPVRIGGSVRWRADEIRGWIQAGCPDRRTWEAMKKSA